MSRISVKEAYDLHVHSHPSLFERIADDVELARRARDDGMDGIMLKCHMESTVSRAYHTMKQVPGIQVFGGIVLNHHVGGLNPSAVEAALKMGGKQVWMPTYHSKAHEKIYGSIGTYGYQDTNTKSTLEPITVFNEKGKLSEDTLTILNLVKQYDIILGTAHLSTVEGLSVISTAREMGCKKVMLTHPFFKPPGADIEVIKKAIDMGAFIEFCAGTLSPIPGYGRLEYYIEVIEKFGVNHIIISSDAGQPRKAYPPETIRVFAQLLNIKGISESDLRIMMVENPRFLLDQN